MIAYYFKIFLGLFFILLGLIYIYRPNIVYKINDMIKEVLLNNSYIAMLRIKLAFLFILLGIIFFYMGITKICGN
jgi:hypothetical protein